MMRDRPTEVRQTLEVLVVRKPKDWVGELDKQALWAAAKNADDHLERIQNC
ncbi:hypothetical protein D187_005513 [Cystobacter fuscus DSM 2262]|uniref:Uncharacterized protein n=1 Tax=Cystobacter fuscus (strain ATCC 25194 / DSM 2262 / NBRC 100088 / M29) TaxID=1242864 RepID=S9QSU9_CYSF2|nr:hypothetical protein [Cystobacter fuscus]EPX64379.1 hypothetical protein D187_005513 [Cystobacter fuscus DSM 2262]